MIPPQGSLPRTRSNYFHGIQEYRCNANLHSPRGTSGASLGRPSLGGRIGLASATAGSRDAGGH